MSNKRSRSLAPIIAVAYFVVERRAENDQGQRAAVTWLQNSQLGTE